MNNKDQKSNNEHKNSINYDIVDYNNIDYEKIGFKAGLEIHQQLETKKLFCDCYTKNLNETGKTLFTIKRYLRTGFGETGEIDKAALHEQKKKKSFHYQVTDNVCLVELDEEPPHELNKEALKIAIEVGKLLNINFFEKTQVMRKTVVDGSNTTGFQRTILIGVDGLIKSDFGNVKIETLCLEEDAAKIIERKEDYDIYNLEKLGIPLIEIATAPDLKNPKAVQEAAAYLGMILRSTKVKRGLGTIRQDVNISIKNGNRVELKGVQDLKNLKKIVENEVKRQINLLKIKEELIKKNIKINFVKKELTKILLEEKKDKKDDFIKRLLSNKNNIVHGLGIKKFNGLLGFELFNNYRLGTELSGYVKTLGFGGLIHSDEDEKNILFQKIFLKK